MKILIISNDRTLFDPESPSAKELLETAALAEQMHIIVLGKKGKVPDVVMQKLSTNVFLYPTNSRFSFSYVRDALRIADRHIVFQSGLIADIVEAEDPFFSARAAYEISRSYNKNFIVRVTNTLRSYFVGKGKLSVWRSKRIARTMLPLAHAVVASSQLIGEEVSVLVPSVENSIYVLSTPVTARRPLEAHAGGDVRQKYPQFNLLLLTVVESRDKNILKLLTAIIRNMRLHYPKMGLIVIDNDDFFSAKATPGIVWEKNVRDLTPYFTAAHIFIDVSNMSRPGGVLMEAAMYGCPIVAAPSPASESEVVPGKNGFVADPLNLAEFSGKIVEIFETPGLRETIKLFRLEVDKLTIQTPVEYNKSILEIWKKYATNAQEQAQQQISEDNSEDPTATLVHTLVYTREYVKKIRQRISNNMNTLTGPKRIERAEQLEATDNNPLDVDSILR